MTENSLIVDILFWVCSGLAILFGLGVVVLRDIFKAALCLLTSLLMLAVLFVLLNAEFIGAVQVLVNVGAVAILIIVTIMVVRDVAGRDGRAKLAVSASGFVVSLLVLVLIGLTSYGTEWLLELGGGLRNSDAVADALFNEPGVLNNAVEPTGTLLLREFVLPLQIVGLIIAATVTSAITLMRGALSDEPLQEGEGG